VKITIFGLTISSSWGNGHATPYRAILKALHRRGHRIHFYEKDVAYYAAHRDLARPNFCELHLYSDWREVRGDALCQAEDSDVVLCASFCPEGAQIVDEALDIEGPLKAFYDLDTPVTLSKLERGETEYLRPDQIPEFDLYLSFTGGATLEKLTNRWEARLAVPLYGCVDAALHKRVASRPEFACDLSYMGTYAADRQRKLEELFLEPSHRLAERSFVLAGSLYPWQWQWPQNVRRIEHVTPADHSALYSSSRLTLNITRSEMARWGYCPSGRFFEAAACRTPILTDWFEGLDSFFDVGDYPELLVANSSEDAIAAINLPDSELQKIAARARERTLSEHTGERRAEQLIAALEQAGSHPSQSRSEVA
jgi:spore maturation protein CgeB